MLATPGRSRRLQTIARRSAFIGGCLILVIVLSVWGWKKFWEQSPSQGQLEQDIMMELPPGSSQDAMFAFLDAHGARYSRKVHVADDYFYFKRQKDVSGDTPVIAALINRTGRALFGSTFLNLYFLLRPDGSLDRHFIEEGVDGL